MRDRYLGKDFYIVPGRRSALSVIVHCLIFRVQVVVFLMNVRVNGNATHDGTTMLIIAVTRLVLCPELFCTLHHSTAGSSWSNLPIECLCHTIRYSSTGERECLNDLPRNGLSGYKTFGLGVILNAPLQRLRLTGDENKLLGGLQSKGKNRLLETEFFCTLGGNIGGGS